MSATRIALTLCLLLTAACQLQTKLPAAEAAAGEGNLT